MKIAWKIFAQSSYWVDGDENFDST